ncbi:MAG: hypothetical protein IH810_00805 [Proteobacteria bacterium]|nr:hypothetical protein [Pseudomonadota bacterium]
MHKAILIMLLAVVSSSAMAEWIEVAKDKEETFTAYADPATIRKTNNIVSMWVLIDYKTVQMNASEPYMSKLGVRKYDCKEKQNTATIKTLHSKNMGVGKYIGIIGSRSWLSVPSGTITELFWKLACGL